jgi:O-antigen/teichoic acid export membrane protein
VSLKKQLIRSGTGSILLRIIGTGLAFVLSVILARTLGPDGFGLYSFVLTLLVFLSIPIQAGFPNLTVREVSKAHLKNDWATMKGILWWTLKIIGIYFVGLALLLLIVTVSDMHWLSEERLKVFLAGFFLIPLLSILVIQNAYIRGLGRVIIGVIPDSVIRPGLALLFLISAIYLFSDTKITPLMAMGGYLASVFIAFCVSLILMWELTPKENRSTSVLKVESNKWKKAAYPLTIVGGLQLMYSYTDILILGLFHENTDVGVYRAVGQLGTLVVFGLSAINQMLHPHFSKLYAANELDKLQKIVTYSSLAIFTFAIIPAVVFLFSGEYIVGFIPLAILTMGQLANASFGSVGALLNMTGHEKDAMKGMMYSLGVNFVLAFLLIPTYGMVGAATATATSLMAWNLILRYYVKKRLNIESIGFIQIIKQRHLN